MKLFVTFIAALSLTIFTQSVLARHGHGHGGLHKCLEEASKIKQGYYGKLEYLTLTDKGVKTFEIEINDENGVEWELMCDESSGTIYEIEREVESASDPLFKRKMKIDEATAAKTATSLYPGKIVHTEYEIEDNGAASYEFDIYDSPSVTYKVEVDATTGEVVEVNIEKWDIGREKSSR